MKFRLALFTLLTCGLAYGQTFGDALRYSLVSPQGSARFAGTGGSLTPLGVDITTLHTNPAGIGWNRYNLAQVTPGFNFTNTDGVLEGAADGTSVSESATNVTLPSLGILLAGTTRSVNWSTLNFGVSVSRMADFNQQIRFDGATEGSIFEGFALQATANGPTNAFNPYGDGLAIPFLIEENGEFFSDFFDFDTGEQRGGGIGRSGLYDRSGGITEVAIGFGGNYREKFLWGLSIGIPFFNYDESLTYEEVDDQDFIPAFENSFYNTNLSATGTGFNLKFGAIYLPTEQLRISAAIHTPTYYSIDETYSTTLGYFYTEDGDALGGTEESPLGNFTYNLRTPLRFLLGAGYLVGSSGFVSVDADYTDYTSNSISFDDFATAADDINADIDAFLTSSIGVRIGGELNLKPFQARAGVGYRQSAVSDFFEGLDEATLTYSGGVGYSTGKFFVDLAAQYAVNNSFQDVYDVDPFRQTVLTDRSRVSALLTVGFRGWNAGF